eukprot:gene8700-17977_t
MSSGIDSVLTSIDETELRASISRLLMFTAQKLDLCNTTTLVAVTIFHRYATFKGMLGLLGDDRTILCAGIMFLSCKVDENCRPLRDIVNVVFRLLDGDIHKLSNEECHRLKEGVVSQEQVILRALAFNTYVELPNPFLLNYARSLLLNQCPVKIAWSLLSDSFISNDCVITLPQCLACACLRIAIDMVGANKSLHSATPLAISIIHSPWWRIFGVEDQELEKTIDAVLSVQKKFPVV